ncbi:MAG: metallophosphoesterase, partial [Spirochaetota bacterium]
GHYHLEKQCTVDGVAIHITPSTFFQLDDNSEGFALLTHTIGWRIIELDGDNLYTRIQWL